MLLIDLVALMGLIALMGHAFIAINMCHLDDQAELGTYTLWMNAYQLHLVCGAAEQTSRQGAQL